MKIIPVVKRYGCETFGRAWHAGLLDFRPGVLKLSYKFIRSLTTFHSYSPVRFLNKENALEYLYQRTKQTRARRTQKVQI